MAEGINFGTEPIIEEPVKTKDEKVIKIGNDTVELGDEDNKDYDYYYNQGKALFEFGLEFKKEEKQKQKLLLNFISRNILVKLEIIRQIFLKE